MKLLLLLYIKHTHFTFNEDIYLWLDSVVIRSPLKYLLANVFMYLLEESITPILKRCFVQYKKYLHDTCECVNSFKTDHFTKTLSIYDKQTHFTFQLENDQSIWFLHNL